MLKFQDLNVCWNDFQVAISKVLHLFFAKAAQDPNTNVPAHLSEILTEASTKTTKTDTQTIFYKSKDSKVYKL